ncbi:MAG: shikimate dehydrogenase [Saprospiraceae bacterium]
MKTRQFGLIGYPLGHSFSRAYFEKKFEQEHITDASYALFPLESIEQLPGLLEHYPDMCGLNVTIPYKEAVIPFLDALHPDAAAVGAVNTIAFQDGKKVGYNTDIIGFQASFEALDPDWNVHTDAHEALILGTGGAAKAVVWVFEKMGIRHRLVSRTPKGEQLAYSDLEAQNWNHIRWIIHTSPLGTYPKVELCPALPFESLSRQHFVHDLIYNPAETLLLQHARARGCAVRNGLTMLTVQAESAWAIWQSL